MNVIDRMRKIPLPKKFVYKIEEKAKNYIIKEGPKLAPKLASVLTILAGAGLAMAKEYEIDLSSVKEGNIQYKNIKVKLNDTDISLNGNDMVDYVYEKDGFKYIDYLNKVVSDTSGDWYVNNAFFTSSVNNPLRYSDLIENDQIKLSIPTKEKEINKLLDETDTLNNLGGAYQITDGTLVIPKFEYNGKTHKVEIQLDGVNNAKLNIKFKVLPIVIDEKGLKFNDSESLSNYYFDKNKLIDYLTNIASKMKDTNGHLIVKDGAVFVDYDKDNIWDAGIEPGTYIDDTDLGKILTGRAIYAIGNISMDSLPQYIKVDGRNVDSSNPIYTNISRALQNGISFEKLLYLVDVSEVDADYSKKFAIPAPVLGVMGLVPLFKRKRKNA